MCIDAYIAAAAAAVVSPPGDEAARWARTFPCAKKVRIADSTLCIGYSV